MFQIEWDEAKAESNFRKHGVAFTEAASVFGDALSVTAYDPDRSEDEDRYLTMGISVDGRVLIVSLQIAGTRFGSLAPEWQLAEKGSPMKKTSRAKSDDLRPEYPPSVFKNGKRGKYAARYRERTNLVLLAPDVAAAFSSSEAVNEALRLLMQIAKTASGK